MVDLVITLCYTEYRYLSTEVPFRCLFLPIALPMLSVFFILAQCFFTVKFLLNFYQFFTKCHMSQVTHRGVCRSIPPYFLFSPYMQIRVNAKNMAFTLSDRVSANRSLGQGRDEWLRHPWHSLPICSSAHLFQDKHKKHILQFGVASYTIFFATLKNGTCPAGLFIHHRV